NSNTNDPQNLINSGQNYGSSGDTGQNDENSDDIDQSRSDTADNGQGETNANEVDRNEGNDQNENWYDGFWNNWN
ncbi:MAG TPA: hypothetical protein VHO92_00740, partial [Methanobacterium sp.]|nr:hypothetical protein [Methanobacterium sp.]